jgi:hypothetical protein
MIKVVVGRPGDGMSFRAKRCYWLIRRRFLPALKREVIKGALLLAIAIPISGVWIVEWFAKEVADRYECTERLGGR